MMPTFPRRTAREGLCRHLGPLRGSGAQRPQARGGKALALAVDRDRRGGLYALLETFALLQSRAGLEAARACEHAIRPLLRVTWVDQDLHRRAFRRLERLATRSVSLVDCTSFETMAELGLRAAFAYDPHFEEQGFTLLQTVGDLVETDP